MIKKQDIKKNGCLNHLLLIIVIVVGYFIYSKVTFPIDLQGRKPELFNSSQVQNLLPLNTLQNSTLLKNQHIKICQDLQISKKGFMYCGSQTGKILQIDINNNYSTKIIGQRVKGGQIYGLKLSTDQKTLYFINHNEGLCSINLQNYQTRFLVGTYRNKKLFALNTIQVNPEDPNIVYFAQSSYLFPTKMLQKDVLLGNSLGRLFQFNLIQNQLKLIFQGLYFANGLAFQKYQGVSTMLVAESSRYRIQRIFLEGQKKGTNITVIQNLPVVLDNMKVNKKGQIWIGGPVVRNNINTFSENNPWIRQLIILLPSWIIDGLVDRSLMGGVKIIFSQQFQARSENYIFQSMKDFSFITSIIEKQNFIYFSSLLSEGILRVPIQNIEQIQSQKQKKQNELKSKQPKQQQL